MSPHTHPIRHSASNCLHYFIFIAAPPPWPYPHNGIGLPWCTVIGPQPLHCTHSLQSSSTVWAANILPQWYSRSVGGGGDSLGSPTTLCNTWDFLPNQPSVLIPVPVAHCNCFSPANPVCVHGAFHWSNEAWLCNLLSPACLSPLTPQGQLPTVILATAASACLETAIKSFSYHWAFFTNSEYAIQELSLKESLLTVL